MLKTMMLNVDYRTPQSYVPFGTYPPTQPAQGISAPQLSSPLLMIQLLGQLLQSLTALSASWSSMLSPAPPLVGAPAAPQGSSLLPPAPSDPQEFASYLQAQRLGGTLEGKTGIAQADALPGTRFGLVQQSQPWHASVARNYAYQFAAYAVDANALTPEGVAAGQQAMTRLSPEAQLFTQVASVFKGNLLQGPGFYNNPGLKQLLLSRGLGELANQPGVGETDVQSIGAITKALDRGLLTLNDVIQSGAIDNLQRYQQVIQYVQGGQFHNDLRFYDSVPV